MIYTYLQITVLHTGSLDNKDDKGVIKSDNICAMHRDGLNIELNLSSWSSTHSR